MGKLRASKAFLGTSDLTTPKSTLGRRLVNLLLVVCSWRVVASGRFSGSSVLALYFLLGPLARRHSFHSLSSLCRTAVRPRTTVGSAVGNAVGRAVGKPVGGAVGSAIGTAISSDVGSTAGRAIGRAVGKAVGTAFGSAAGSVVGTANGKRRW